MEEYETIIVPKRVLDITDYLMQLAPFASPDGVVKTEDDWKIVIKLFEAFVKCYPKHYESFLVTVDRMRTLNQGSGGYSKDKEFKHQMEIPEKYYQLIRVFFPLQDFDTLFTRRLVREIPAFKAT